MAERHAPAQRHFETLNGQLLVGKVPIEELANEYGTPCFVYDRGVLDAKWERLRAALPREFAICYSVKANPNQAVIQHFLSRGAGLEIASAGEFCQGLAAGCKPERMLFAGPSKTEQELELVLEKRIGEIHLESLLECRRVAKIAARLGMQAGVSVRINPNSEAEGGAMRMGGRAVPFGVDEEVLDDFLETLLALPHLHFCGIHLFVGTQILDARMLLAQYRKGLQIARRVSERIGRPLETIDFGGGLGVPYFPHETELDTDCLGAELNDFMQEVRASAAFKGTRFVVEPGRFLTAEAGIYVVRVNDIKVSRGKKFLIVDGGMNHHLAASGNLGQTIKRNYPISILNRIHQPDTETVDVVGPLCTPLDVLARGVALPPAEVGDLIGVFQSGAYGRSASPLGFLSHRTPPEVWVDQDHHRLARRRGEYADFLRDQEVSDSVSV